MIYILQGDTLSDRNGKVVGIYARVLDGGLRMQAEDPASKRTCFFDCDNVLIASEPSASPGPAAAPPDRAMLSRFKRDLKLVERIKTRARELGIEPAIVARLVGEHADDLATLLEELPQYTLDGLAESYWEERNGEKPVARVGLPPEPTRNPAPKAASWDAIAEKHYSKAAASSQKEDTP